MPGGKSWIIYLRQGVIRGMPTNPGDNVYINFQVDPRGNCPGNILMCMPEWDDVIFRVRKHRPKDEGYQKNILSTALSTSFGMRLAIAVDTDVDTYSMDDIIWALTTQVDAASYILVVTSGGMGQTFQPAERSLAGDREWTQSNTVFSGGIGLDATVPFRFKRGVSTCRISHR